MAKDVIGVGVIGTGFGVRVQIPVWQKTPGAKVVAVCSHNLERAKTVAQKFGIAHAVSDPKALASLADVDLVSVTTPPHEHYTGAMAAIAAGKHVLCEKPFALDERQGREMYEAAKRRGVIHLTNYEFRTTPARAEMHRRVQAGEIGEVRHIAVTAFADFIRRTRRLNKWWYDEKCGGGWLGASGSHTIDTMRYLFGDIVGVSGQVDTLVKDVHVLGQEETIKSTVDDTFYLVFRFANGAVGAYLGSAAGETTGPPMRIEAYGSKGTLLLEGDRLLAGKAGDTTLSPVELAPPDVPQEIVDPHYVPFTVWTRRIVEAVKAGKQIAPSFEDGWKSQQVIDAARRSSKTGRWVEIKG